MFTIKDAKMVRGEKSSVVQIILKEADGGETIITVASDDLNYIFGFVKCGKDGGVDVPAELIVKGSSDIVGELFFQAGNCYPELIQHCVRRSTEKIANAIANEIKKSGIDPIGEALKKMPAPEKSGGWN